MPNKKLGQYVGKETILDCEITAHPHGEMYWMKDGVKIDFITEHEKYVVRSSSCDVVLHNTILIVNKLLFCFKTAQLQML